MIYILSVYIRNGISGIFSSIYQRIIQMEILAQCNFSLLTCVCMHTYIFDGFHGFLEKYFTIYQQNIQVFHHPRKFF